MPNRGLLVAALTALVALVFAAPVGATRHPSLPKASNGNRVQIVGTGVPTPTAFAFAGSTVFAGSGPQLRKRRPGGLFTVAHGKATKVPDTPANVFGLAWQSNLLYVSTGRTIVALGGWNGTTFSSTTTIYSNQEKEFQGLNGIAFGPDGRLYAGLTLDGDYDHAADPYSPSQAVVSMTATGGDFEIVAAGLRQPFQLAFPEGSRFPYVTVLAQDSGGGPTPDDEIVVAQPGQDYGFPSCTWLPSQKQRCKGFAKPAIFLPPHAAPMGIGSIGNTVYLSLYGGTGHGPEVATLSKRGKRRPFLTGFPAPTIALGVNHGKVYVGDLTGTIYEVAAK